MHDIPHSTAHRRKDDEQVGNDDRFRRFGYTVSTRFVYPTLEYGKPGTEHGVYRKPYIISNDRVQSKGMALIVLVLFYKKKIIIQYNDKFLYREYR